MRVSCSCPKAWKTSSSSMRFKNSGLFFSSFELVRMPF